MSALRTLLERIQAAFPEAKVTQRWPGRELFLDIECGKTRLVVEWCSKRGFGVSDVTDPDSHRLGGFHDATFAGEDAVEAAFKKIEAILTAASP